MPSDRRRPGRPAHAPTDETRALVLEMVSTGRNVADMAVALSISQPTLRAHYAVELSAPRPQKTFALPGFDGPKPPRPGMPRAGRPEHVPTDVTRERVEILVASRMPAWQIAAALEISEPTLRLHYERELAGGRARRTAEVLEALFTAAKAGNVSAQKAFLDRTGELEEPPPPEAKAEPLGKKAAAAVAAVNATAGTDWDGLLPN